MAHPEDSPAPLPDFHTITDYAEWAAKYWLHTPGTQEAQAHARAKLEEETDELIAALHEGQPEDIISEAGDVLWTAVATGSNAGIVLSDVISSAFPAYIESKKSVTIHEIDSIALSLLEGTNPREITEYLKHDEHALGKGAQFWFKLGDTVHTPPETFGDALLAVKRRDAADALLNVVLVISFVAQKYAGAGLDSVIKANYRKIEDRVHTGRPVTKVQKL